MKQKLLLLTPELPYPLQSGGKVKTWNMIKAFARDYEVTVLCPLKENDESHVADFIANTPIAELITDPVKVPRTAVNLLKSYALGLPLNVLRTYSAKLQTVISSRLHEFAVVMVDHYEVFGMVSTQQLAQAGQPLVVYHAHNTYHQIWQRYSQTSLNPAIKTVAAIEAWRVKHYEKNVCDNTDIVFAAPNDIEQLEPLCHQQHFAETLHLGSDSVYNLPTLDIDKTTPTLCYAGFLAWEPNVLGLLWFLEKVWPNLKARHPNLRFEIAGKKPDARLVAMVANLVDVELLGFVDNLDHLYQRSRVSVCPLQFGSGVKVKVASSLARGMPTVTTSIGVEGLAVERGKHVLVADNPQTMQQCIHSLLVDDVLWRRISQNSRHFMQTNYSAAAMFNSMLKAIRDRQYSILNAQGYTARLGQVATA